MGCVLRDCDFNSQTVTDLDTKVQELESLLQISLALIKKEDMIHMETASCCLLGYKLV